MNMRQRAKPLLGTLVEIRADCDDEATFIAATDAAFIRIENVHRAMSFHEPTSDFQAIARCPAGASVTVDQDTWHVLQLALQMERDSDGVFNPTIAPTLVRRSLLPRPADAGKAPDLSTLEESIRLDERRVVRVLRPVWIDLGGIAKGYAVDVATTMLVKYGARSGVVNAGGDLRVFGAVGQPVCVRHPLHPNALLPLATLTDLSGATSGNYFVASHCPRASDVPGAVDSLSAIVGNRAPCAKPHASVTVFAVRCAVADALTKVLWLKGMADDRCRALVDRYDAQAIALDVYGNPTYG
jgi:FAD:protein FMN transferase